MLSQYLISLTTQHLTNSLLSFLDDGLIDESDLREVMKACMVENGMHFDEKEVSDLATALFEDAVQVSIIFNTCKHSTSGEYENMIHNTKLPSNLQPVKYFYIGPRRYFHYFSPAARRLKLIFIPKIELFSTGQARAVF